MKLWTKILIVLILVLLIIQIPIFHPDKNYSKEDPVNDIAKKYEMPMYIQMDLYNACYDCHSNYTQHYPWYYHIQPVSWWMDYHIQDAKKHLNFSEFAAYSPKRAAHKFHEIEEEMNKHGMPLRSYLLMHDHAKLTDAQYKEVAEWAKKMQKQVLDKMKASPES